MKLSKEQKLEKEVVINESSDKSENIEKMFLLLIQKMK